MQRKAVTTVLMLVIAGFLLTGSGALAGDTEILRMPPISGSMTALTSPLPGTLIATPDPANSYVEWRNLGGAKAFVCPGGDGSWLFASIRDAANQPIAGAIVMAGFVTSCNTCICPPVAAVTDNNGEANLFVRAGLNTMASTACCVVMTTVQCQGVVIPWSGTGLPSDTRDWVSPDYNADCQVTPVDSIVFAGDYLTGACRSDFDDDGTVGLMDYVELANHFGHQCSPSPSPDPANCYVEWRDFQGCPYPFICPDGDGSWIFASIRDNNNQPIPGVLVTATFTSACDMCVCQPVSGVTDINGEAKVYVYAGLDATGSTACCVVTTTADCMGVPIPWSGGGLSDTRNWVSPDYDADCEVAPADTVIFFSDYFTTACRSDYNCDGIVDLVDYGIFASHYGHECDPSPAPDPGHSYVEWRDLSSGCQWPLVCPDGDGSWLFVKVMDQYNQPISGVVVTPYFTASCNMAICPPSSWVTDTNGEAKLYLRIGLDVSASTACCVVTSTVKCLGVTIPWTGTGGLLSDTRNWLSTDLNGDGMVATADSLIFDADYFTTACRTDYNCDGMVNLSDWMVFANHYGHRCNPAPAPDPGRSSLEWRNLGCAGKAFVCPCGNGSSVHVQVIDQYNAPMVGVTVTPSWLAGCPVCQCGPVSAVTDMTGDADLAIHMGLDVTGSTNCCNVTSLVKCQGVQLSWKNTGRLTDTRDWLSPDLNGDCEVATADSLIFDSDYFTTACRTDYNCDGIVNLADYITFGSHWGHSCDPSGFDDGTDGGPIVTALAQNRPNPFSPSTDISFSVGRTSRVSLTVYDVRGRQVRSLVDGTLDGGEYNVVWDGRDDRHEPVSSGVYFCRLTVPGHTDMIRMVLLR